MIKKIKKFFKKPVTRTWRYVCEMNEHEIKECVHELFWVDRLKNMSIKTFKRPGFGYINVSIELSDESKWLIQFTDWGTVIITCFNSRSVASLDTEKFFEFLKENNVKIINK